MKCSVWRAAASISLMAAAWAANAQTSNAQTTSVQTTSTQPGKAQSTEAQVTKGPTPEATDAARALAEASRTGRLSALQGLVLPFPKMLSEMGFTPGPQFGVVMRRAVLPVVFEHADDFTAIQVHSYATLLSLPDMKAITAFYNSPAGKDLVRLRPMLIQREASAAFKLMATLHPEIDAKAQQTLKAHGWSKG